MFHYLLFRIFKALLFSGAHAMGLFHHGMIISVIVAVVIGTLAYKLFYRR